MPRISEAERQRRSDLAKRLHAEGKLGRQARKGGLRSVQVRQHRASSIAQRMLEEHAHEVEQVLVDALKNGTRAERLKALDLALKNALRAEGLGLAEAKSAHEHRDREELIAVLAEKLTSGPTASALAQHLIERHGHVIEGTAVEVQPGNDSSTSR